MKKFLSAILSLLTLWVARGTIAFLSLFLVKLIATVPMFRFLYTMSTSSIGSNRWNIAEPWYIAGISLLLAFSIVAKVSKKIDGDTFGLRVAGIVSTIYYVIMLIISIVLLIKGSITFGVVFSYIVTIFVSVAAIKEETF